MTTPSATREAKHVDSELTVARVLRSPKLLTRECLAA